MSLCGCFKCCLESDDEDSRRQTFVNEGFERDKKCSKEDLTKDGGVATEEEKLWGSVLGELQIRFTTLREPGDDVVPEKSMAWAFKILKPVQVGKPKESKSDDSGTLYLKILKKTPTESKITQWELIKEPDDRQIPLSTSPNVIMSNVVPSIGKPAPAFKGKAVVDGAFKDISLTDYAGKYVVLFFYPLDFTFVCPTEIIAFSDRAEDFRNIGCELIACSTDSHFTHLEWVSKDRKSGGLGPMNIPLLADKSMAVAKSYGVLIEDEGIALRGLFIIDGNQTLRQVTINDLPVGRDVDETLRLVQAFQFTDEHGEVCPAGWKPGSKSMKADPKLSKEYFESAN